MSVPAARQDASLSAASFLASINAESSTSFGSEASTSATSSAPSLPISAKVSLIDAQIDALESRIEQTITAHASQLRERAASTRTVDRDLNQLWRSINQTSSRLVTVGPQLAPIASNYHDALAQSSKQALLISVLSDLLAATRHLETLEKLQQQSDLSKVQAQLPESTKLMQPFVASPALSNLPAVLELRARFGRLEKACDKPKSTTRSADEEQAIPASQAPALPGKSIASQKEASSADATQTLSPALKVLEEARAIIVSRGAEEGWKEVRIELDAPAPPPPAITAPVPPAASTKANSQRSSFDVRPEHLLREDLAPGSASLTRNSSSSSISNARVRHKPKLGARVIRPQDQLGSGPFNAEDTPLDEDGWGLDEDDEETSIPPRTTSINQPNSIPPSSQPMHQTVAALVRDDGFDCPGSSVGMQRSVSSTSSQRSTFAIQETVSHTGAPSGDTADAWDLGDEEEKNDEADAWDLEDDVAPAHQPTSPPKASPHVANPVGSVHTRAPSSGTAGLDAWGLEDEEVEAEDDPRETEEPQKQAVSNYEAAVVPAPAPQSSAGPIEADAEDPWETDDQAAQSTATQQGSEAHAAAPILATQARSHAEPLAPVAAEKDVKIVVSGSQADKVSNEAHSEARQVATRAPEKADASEEESVPPRDTASAHQPATVDAVVPAPVKTTANNEPMVVEQHLDEDQEADGWGFEENSSSSEADRAEFAPMTPMHKRETTGKTTSAPVQAPEAESATTKAVTAQKPPLAIAQASKSTPVTVTVPQAHETQASVSPPSPSGWPDDFSDSESTGVPASESFTRAPAPYTTNRTASSTRSISRDSRMSSSTSAKHVQELAASTPSAAAVTREACTISKRSQDLVQLAETTMSTVLSRLQGGKPSNVDADQDDVEALAATVCRIFELHRALMPVAHGEALRDVPSLAMQFFNDCEYLARELTRLIGDKGEEIATAWIEYDAEAARRWKTKELAKLEQEASWTRGSGQRWFEAQMTSQTKILLDTLMEADGFARTFDDHRFQRCERCIKQVVQTLQQLAKAWRPVLVASRFHAAIGRLIDLVFQKVLHDVLDLEDIGETESEKIASLVKTLGSLEALFSAEEGSEQPSTAPVWVPSWFKTSYLIEILTGSLVDIEFLAFEAGALVDYSRKELTGLIKALFADTPNRSKLLRRIETAPVEVLAH